MPRRCIESWRDHHPGWEFKLWDNDAVYGRSWRNADKFSAEPTLNGKADIVRVEILYENGGIHLDADSECVKPIPEWMLDVEDSLSCYEHEKLRGNLIACGGIAASVPKSKFMAECIREIHRTDPGNRMAWENWGPGLFTRVNDRVPLSKILSSHYFLPWHYTGNASPNVEGHASEVVGMQRWGSTFQSYGSKELT
jgi:mannosyltransferase OCH1-like enzyme